MASFCIKKESKCLIVAYIAQCHLNMTTFSLNLSSAVFLIYYDQSYWPSLSSSIHLHPETSMVPGVPCSSSRELCDFLRQMPPFQRELL